MKLERDESNYPKTYIAKYSYKSQTEGCLSFSAGDKCVLVSQTKDGWWLVNIGGKEGWTPGDFWDEDVRVSSIQTCISSK